MLLLVEMYFKAGIIYSLKNLKEKMVIIIEQVVSVQKRNGIYRNEKDRISAKNIHWMSLQAD